MNKLLLAIKKDHTNKFISTMKVESHQVDVQGNLPLWTLLQFIEDGVKEPKQLLSEVAPVYRSAISEVSLQLFEKAKAGETLEVEARFYEFGRRRVLLKAFIRLKRSGNKSKRIARAEYVLKTTHVQEMMKSA